MVYGWSLTANYCAPPAHHQDTCRPSGLEAVASNESEYGMIHGDRCARCGKCGCCIPGTLDSEVVRFGDMIVSVRGWVVERHGDYDGRWGIRSVSVRGQAELTASGSSLLKILARTIGGQAVVRERNVYVDRSDQQRRLTIPLRPVYFTSPNFALRVIFHLSRNYISDIKGKNNEHLTGAVDGVGHRSMSWTVRPCPSFT